MASSNARLLVEIQASTAKFQEDLGRAAAIADANARKIDATFAGLKTKLVGSFTAIAAGIGAAILFVNKQAESIGRFKGLSEQIGDTAENVAALQKVALTSGIALEQVATASVKLNGALANIGEGQDGGAAGRALKAIGVAAEDLKKQSPVTQLETLAKALDKFADNGQKAAVLFALFGARGAVLQSFFNDLVESGGRVITVTQQQIEVADRYTKAQARLRADIEVQVQQIAVDMIPAQNAFTDALHKTILAIIGVDEKTSKLTQSNNVAIWAERTAEGVAVLVTAIELLARGFQIVGLSIAEAAAVSAAIVRREFSTALEIGREWQRDIAAIFSRDLFSTQLEKSFEKLRKLNAEFKAKNRPSINFNNDTDKKTGKTGVDRATEAERYLETLQRQLSKMEEITVLDRVMNDIESGRLKLSGAVSKELLFDIAIEIDQRTALKKLLQDEASARETTSRATTAAQVAAKAEVDQLDAGNVALRDEIALIDADAKKRTELAIARNAGVIALKEEALAALTNADGNEALVLLYKQQIKLLQDRSGLIAERGVAEALAEEAKSTKEFYASLGLTFSSAFEDAIVEGNNLRDVIKALEKDIVRLITRQLVTKPLAKGIGDALGQFTSGGSGGGLGGIFGAIVKSIFGGGSADLSGINFGGGLASGTDFARGGLTLVGERGPELVNLPRGSQVTPATETRAIRQGRSGNVINIAVNVLPGASRASGEQAAAEVGRAAQRALRSIR